MKYFRAFSFLLFFLFGGGAGAAPHPKVLVTIPPLFSLAQDLLEGVAEVDLLLKNPADPHTYYMKPSDVRRVEDADLVFWVGPDLEGFLAPLLKKHQGKVLTALGAPGLQLYPYASNPFIVSEGTPHEQPACPGGCGHAHPHQQGGEGHAAGALDPHLWLDPVNMSVLMRVLRETFEARFVVAYPESDKQKTLEKLDQNQVALEKRLLQLNADLKKALSDEETKGRPPLFFVAHNALQYLEKRYKMGQSFPLEGSLEKGVTLKRLRTLKKVAREKQVRCLFGDQSFNPDTLRKFAGKLGLRYETLDVLGYGESENILPYTDMMRLLGRRLVACLQEDKK